MNKIFINSKFLAALVLIFSSPILMMAIMAFFDTESNIFSILGFQELLTPLRLGELLKIMERSLIVSISSTIIAFFISYMLFRFTTNLFQYLFHTLITLPFIINEAVRVFSWQTVLAENGLLNNLLSVILKHDITLFSGSNVWNIYLIMTITCVPFGIFICSGSLKTIPKIYWDVINDLKINTVNRILRIVIPFSKFAIMASFIINFFISFSLSSEVNFLGGDSKISIRNLVLSFMSASKFQAIFSLGLFMLLLMFTIGFIYKITTREKTLGRK